MSQIHGPLIEPLQFLPCSYLVGLHTPQIAPGLTALIADQFTTPKQPLIPLATNNLHV